MFVCRRADGRAGAPRCRRNRPEFLGSQKHGAWKLVTLCSQERRTAPRGKATGNAQFRQKGPGGSPRPTGPRGSCVHTTTNPAKRPFLHRSRKKRKKGHALVGFTKWIRGEWTVAQSMWATPPHRDSFWSGRSSRARGRWRSIDTRSASTRTNRVCRRARRARSGGSKNIILGDDLEMAIRHLGMGPARPSYTVRSPPPGGPSCDRQGAASQSGAPASGVRAHARPVDD